LNLLGKKGALMLKAIVSHGRRIVLPCVRRSGSLYTEQVVVVVVLMSMERKKVMKKERRSEEKNFRGKRSLGRGL
jgi:hypothetical protein